MMPKEWIDTYTDPDDPDDTDCEIDLGQVREWAKRLWEAENLAKWYEAEQWVRDQRAEWATEWATEWPERGSGHYWAYGTPGRVSEEALLFVDFTGPLPHSRGKIIWERYANLVWMPAQLPDVSGAIELLKKE